MQRREIQDRPENNQVPMQRHTTVGTRDATTQPNLPSVFLTERDGGAASVFTVLSFLPAPVAPVTRAWPRDTTATAP